MQRAAEYLDLLAAEAPANDEVARDLAEAHERLADVLGGAGMANLGDAGGAMAHYRQALTMRERLASERPLDLERQRDLAASLRKVARAEPDGVAALALARRAVEVATALADSRPGSARVPGGAGGRALRDGLCAGQLGDFPAALASYHAAAEGHQRRLARAPSDPKALGEYALCEKRMGAIMIRSGRHAEAAEHYRRALAADESRAALAPESAPARRDLSVTCVDLSIALRNLGDRPGASAHLRRALQIREELARADPSNALAQVDLVSVRWRVAGLLLQEGDWRAALRQLDPGGGGGREADRRRQDNLPDVLDARAKAYQLAGNIEGRCSPTGAARSRSAATLMQAATNRAATWPSSTQPRPWATPSRRSTSPRRPRTPGSSGARRARRTRKDWSARSPRGPPGAPGARGRLPRAGFARAWIAATAR